MSAFYLTPRALILAFLWLAPSAPVSAAESLPEEFTLADTPEAELFRVAGRLFEEENYPAAAKHYRDFVDRFGKNPAAAEAQLMLAECLYRQALREAGVERASSEKIFNEAKNEYLKADHLIPRGDHLSASAEFRLGEIEFNLRHYKAAAEMMQKLQTDHPGGLLRGEARLIQGQALLAEHQAVEAQRLLRAALTDQPVYEEEPRMQLAYGIALFEVGGTSESLRYLDKIEAPQAYLYAARAYIKLGKPLVAIERLRQLYQSDPQGPYAELSQYLQAEAFFASKDFLSAMQAYDQFLRVYTRSAYRPGATYKIGLCQYEREDYLAARGSFQSVLQLSPKSEFAELSLYMIGESFMKEGRLKEANFSYSDLAASYATPLAGTALFKQGWTHYKQGELPAAETALRLLLLKYPAHPMAPAAALLVGNVLTHQSRFSDAVHAYQQSLDLLEAGKLEEERKTDLRESCLALLNRANLLAGDYSSLVSGYQYVMKHVKPTLNPWRAATLLYIAEGYYHQGLFDEALGLYREILNSFAVTPEAALAQDGVAWCLFAKGQYAQAEKERQKLSGYKARPPVAPTKTVLMEGKVDAGLYVNNEFETATAWFNQKKYLEALDAYEGFEKAHPDHPSAGEAALQAGWCYYRLEHYGQALKAWERVEEAYKGSPTAVKAAWATADTYFRAGQYDKAVATYQRILQEYPSDPAAGHARLRIAQSHYNAKEVLKAIGDFESILTQAPDTPEAQAALDFLTQLLFLPDAKGPALDALTRVAQARPGTPGASQARFRIARHLYETGDYAAASSNLEQLVALLSGKAELMDAVFFLAESYYNLKRFKDAALAYERFTTNYPGDGRFASALFHLGASRFKLEEFAPAAEAFSRLAKDFSSTQFAPVALFNSALAYRKLGKWEEAAAALKKYVKTYPEEAKGSNAMSELSAIYEEHRQFPQLVDLLSEERSKLPSDDARRVEFTHRLAEAYFAMEDEDKALAEWLAASKSPLKGNPFRLAALAKLGEYYEKKEQWGDAQMIYNDLARNSTDKEWIEAAKARALAAREKLNQAAVPASSAAQDSPAPKPKKKKRQPQPQQEADQP